MLEIFNIVTYKLLQGPTLYKITTINFVSFTISIIMLYLIVILQFLYTPKIMQTILKFLFFLKDTAQISLIVSKKYFLLETTTTVNHSQMKPATVPVSTTLQEMISPHFSQLFL
jgi:hypothetical protein